MKSEASTAVTKNVALSHGRPGRMITRSGARLLPNNSSLFKCRDGTALRPAQVIPLPQRDTQFSQACEFF